MINKITNYYVYVHYKKSNGEPFYVGKGSGNRCKCENRRNPFWKNIVNKNGYEVQILENYLTELKAFEEEKFYIQYFKFLGFNLCNFTTGGEGSSGHTFIPSKEWKAKKSLTMQGTNNPFYGKKHTKESRDKIKLSQKGRKHSLEHRQKVSINSARAKAKIVLNIETGIYYSSCKEAAEYNSFNYSTLKSQLNGSNPNTSNLIYL